MNIIKVLIITGNMDVGGIENQLMHLMRNADKNKFQIDFTTTMEHPYYKDEIESLGGHCIRIPATEGKHFLRYCKALYSVIKEGQYDVVHSHELFHSGMVLAVAKKAGVKSRVVHAHNWLEGDGISKTSFVRKLYNWVMRKLILRNATQFCACSTLAGKFLYGEHIVDQSNYHLIYNSVDTKKFLNHYNDQESGEWMEPDWVNVIQVGRFSDVKNQLFTAAIAQQLKKRKSNIRILCAGNNGNEYEERVRAAIEKYKLQKYMILLGIRNDVDVLLRKSSCFLLPSRYEGMPLVLIEAQSTGIPCVIADTFSHEVDFNLDLIDWMDINANAETWVDAIETAVKKPRAAYQDVCNVIEQNGFDSQIFAQRLCDLYEADVNS